MPTIYIGKVSGVLYAEVRPTNESVITIRHEPEAGAEFGNALSEGLTMHTDVSAFVFTSRSYSSQIKNSGHLQIVGAHSPP
jgi:hypothetical protein